MLRPPLEAHTRTQIDLRLMNLGWILDQSNPHCNVFQEQAKTEEQNQRFEGKKPDYVLYDSGTDTPLAIIEAKPPSGDLDRAMNQAVTRYAQPLSVPLVFVYNEIFVAGLHVDQSRPLKIDGEQLQDFVDQATALRFINEGAEILSAPRDINFNRDELISIFKGVNNLLRKDGLRDGYERFSAFSEILFLKLIDEFEKLSRHRNLPSRFDDRYLWSSFVQRFNNNDSDMLDFISNTVWPHLRSIYGDIFESEFSINKPGTLKRIVAEVDPINLTATDTDVKGDAFEYFLKTVTNGTKDLGEYFTPRHIVRTMVNLVEPRYGETVYDPFCGTGGFLLEVFKYLTLRTDPSNHEMLDWIKRKAIHGRELTSTARITKMNMILFGDGHANIHQMDSLENPVDNKYNVVLSNIPYSQKTEFGALYPISTTNADSVCVQHIFRSLKPHGRAAVIVPETFLYDDGDIGKTREWIVKNSQKFTVVSLPRGVFMPYTPTKTNIIYFQKGTSCRSFFFFVVHNDGFELNTNRKPIPGDSDIKKLLGMGNTPVTLRAQANIVERNIVEDSGNWNLRPFFYMEDVPEVNGDLITLSDDLVEEVTTKVDPTNQPNHEWNVIEVSQNGIFLGDTFEGSEFTQSYKPVQSGDIVYNPYRVNIGSIGVVPPYLDGALASPAYVVMRIRNESIPPSYVVSVLKTPRYLKVIMNYSMSSARANLPFTELTRIKIPKPDPNELASLQEFDSELNAHMSRQNTIRKQIQSYVSSVITDGV